MRTFRNDGRIILQVYILATARTSEATPGCSNQKFREVSKGRVACLCDVRQSLIVPETEFSRQFSDLNDDDVDTSRNRDEILQWYSNFKISDFEISRVKDLGDLGERESTSGNNSSEFLRNQEYL